MSDYKLKYKIWLEDEYFDTETRRELEGIAGNEKEIEERFYTELTFGTGGLRGILGAGTNRMNIYTVRKATQGLANYISRFGEGDRGRGVVIAYDSRHKSPEFAMEAAKVLASNGIRAYVFDELTPTPELSFAVRRLNTIAGIVITASHNPKNYNGYKVYWEDGGQIPLERSEAVLREIDRIEDYTAIRVVGEDEGIRRGLIVKAGAELHSSFLEKVREQSLNSSIIRKIADDFKLIYTPLHGTGNKPVREILKQIGFKNVMVVKEQELPDPDFTTVKYPNPEEKDAFGIAIELAEKEGVDLIIATDPDCDRVGVVVKNQKGDFVPLTGNQVGALLMEYILSQKKSKGELPGNAVVIKTIVTTELARVIADYYGVEIIDVLTGFKFIGEKIKEFDEDNSKTYIFGFEESYGYLAGTHARDKDGVVASMLIAEMAAVYKTRGMSLFEGLEEIFGKYGFFKEGLNSFTLEGKEGIEKIKETMHNLRRSKPSDFDGARVSAVRDYLTRKRSEANTGRVTRLTLPESDVIYFEMEDKSWFCIRPSGTEPKIKVYFGVSGSSHEDSARKLNNLQGRVLKTIKPLLGV